MPNFQKRDNRNGEPENVLFRHFYSTPYDAMMHQTEGIILLADQRTHWQSDFFRKYETLPKAEIPPSFYQHFPDLVTFSDNTLAAQQSHSFQPNPDYCLVLLPLVGALEIQRQDEEPFFVNTGEVFFYYPQPEKEESLSIFNLYEDDLVNYLELWVKRKKISPNGCFIKPFELLKNQLQSIQQQGINVRFHIGKMEGREEAILSFQQEKTFVYVLSGAFEVQNRLLQERDALCLWSCEEVEFEALAQENMLLVVEFL